MNELAAYNYTGQERIFLWPASAKPKYQYAPATIASNWKMPVSPVGEKCPECGDVIEPIAHDTGDGWFLGWHCSSGCCEPIEDGMDSWPFVEETANWRDLQNIGFVLV